MCLKCFFKPVAYTSSIFLCCLLSGKHCCWNRTVNIILEQYLVFFSATLLLEKHDYIPGVLMLQGLLVGCNLRMQILVHCSLLSCIDEGVFEKPVLQLSFSVMSVKEGCVDFISILVEDQNVAIQTVSMTVRITFLFFTPFCCSLNLVTFTSISAVISFVFNLRAQGKIKWIIQKWIHVNVTNYKSMENICQPRNNIRSFFPIAYTKMTILIHIIFILTLMGTWEIFAAMW